MVLGNFSAGIGQGPTVLAVDEDGAGCLILFLVYHFSLSLSLGWLFGCFGLNRHFKQYFSLYRAVSQRKGELSVSGRWPDID